MPTSNQLSLEQEIKNHFTRRSIPFHDHSSDDRRFLWLDFGFGDPAQKRYFRFDAKEKRRRYNPKNWPDAGIPEEHLFIIDDLAARKILAIAPNSGMLVRVNAQRWYYLFTVVDLFLMPKMRVNRPIHQHQEGLKGKWLVDLRNGQRFDALPPVFDAIESYLDKRKTIFGKQLQCYGDYVGENIGQGGVLRQPQHWVEDVRETR
jgi:hypothetical protein